MLLNRMAPKIMLRIEIYSIRGEPCGNFVSEATVGEYQSAINKVKVHTVKINRINLTIFEKSWH